MGMHKNKNKLKLSDWLRWLASGLLIIWAFILGVLVGQGSLANDQQLDNLRKLSLSWFGISFYKEQTPPQTPLRDPQLTFYDQLASKPPAGATPTPAPPPTTAPPAPAPWTPSSI